MSTHISITNCSDTPEGWADSITLILNQMKQELERLTVEVAETKTVMASAVTLLQGLSDRIKEADGDKAKLTELTDELDSNTNALAQAVAANTPAQNETPAENTGNTGTDTGNAGTV